MSDAQKLIADVHHYHQWRGEVLGCGCGWNWPEERTYFCGEEDRISKAHSAHVAAEIDKALGKLTQEPECESSAELREHVEPEFDSDCTVHGVATWSIYGGHEVIHYCTEYCPEDCNLEGEETGEWCDGPLEMRPSRSRWVSGWSEVRPLLRAAQTVEQMLVSDQGNWSKSAGQSVERMHQGFSSLSGSQVKGLIDLFQRWNDDLLNSADTDTRQGIEAIGEAAGYRAAIRAIRDEVQS